MFFRAPATRSVASSAFGLFWAVPAARSQSTVVFRRPPATAPREVPTPLVFVSAKAWDKTSQYGMTSFASMFAERGYMTMEVDIGLPDSKASTSEALLKHFEDELSSHIRLAGIPFAPIIFARSAGGALIAQTYASSNPASGLILIAPSPSTSSDESQEILPTQLQEFDYEPRFPLLVIDIPAREKMQKDENRLLQDGGADFEVVEDLEGQDALMKMEKWMDEVGV